MAFINQGYHVGMVGRGGFEISFTYMHQNKDKKTVKICPRL